MSRKPCLVKTFESFNKKSERERFNTILCNNKTYWINADRNKTFRGETQFVCYDCGTGACGAAIRVQSWE